MLSSRLAAFLVLAVCCIEHAKADTYWACVMTCLDGTRMTPLALDNVSPASQCHGDADGCSFMAFTGDQIDTCSAQAPASVTGSDRYSETYIHFDAYPFPASDTCVSFQTAIAKPAAQATSARRLLDSQNDAQAAHCGCKDMIDFIYQEAVTQIPLGGTGGFCDAVFDYAAGRLDKRYCKTKFKNPAGKDLFPFAGKLCAQLVDPVTSAIGDAFKPICEAGVTFIKAESRGDIDLDQVTTWGQDARQTIVKKVEPYVEKICGPIACSDGSATSGCSTTQTQVAGSVATVLQLGSTAYCGLEAVASGNSSGKSHILHDATVAQRSV